MPSTLTWLDSSLEDQRKMRELINLFGQHESRDELGIGQVRDAFSDLLFPGTSTIHTRARYFLIVPWCAQEAHRGDPRTASARNNRIERTVIDALLRSDDHDNMIGGRAGVKVRTLPSVIYGAALERYGIRTGEYEPAADESEADELTERRVGMWHPTLPPPPAGFPKFIDGGLSMTRAEARWLRERVLATAPGTLIAHLLTDAARLDPESTAPWWDPALVDLPDGLRRQLDHARRFSLAIWGAALLFNLMIAEFHQEKQYGDSFVEHYRDQLDDWAAWVREERTMRGWDIPDMWDLVAVANPRILANFRARAFIERWLDVVATDPAGAADDDAARRLVAERERQVKGPQSRLLNEKLLKVWRGASGSGQLVYRWPQVRRMVLDIRDGIGATDAGA